MSYWYLATPYTNYPPGLEIAAQEAAAQAALLLTNGIPVFSPIAHGHTISKHVDLSHEFWIKLDRKFMMYAKGLIVCQLEGWSNSKGIGIEIDYFAFLKRPVVYMIPGEIPTLEDVVW